MRPQGAAGRPAAEENGGKPAPVADDLGFLWACAPSAEAVVPAVRPGDLVWVRLSRGRGCRGAVESVRSGAAVQGPGAPVEEQPPQAGRRRLRVDGKGRSCTDVVVGVDSESEVACGSERLTRILPPGERWVAVVPDTLSYRHLARTQVTQQDCVVELGSSIGLCTAVLAESAGSVLGLDISLAQLEEARRAFPAVRFEFLDIFEEHARLRGMSEAARCTAAFVDINGDREIAMVLHAVEILRRCCLPQVRLVVVKSEELFAAMAGGRLLPTCSAGEPWRQLASPGSFLKPWCHLREPLPPRQRNAEAAGAPPGAPAVGSGLQRKKKRALCGRVAAAEGRAGGPAGSGGARLPLGRLERALAQSATARGGFHCAAPSAGGQAVCLVLDEDDHPLARSHRVACAFGDLASAQGLARATAGAAPVLLGRGGARSAVYEFWGLLRVIDVLPVDHPLYAEPAVGAALRALATRSRSRSRGAAAAAEVHLLRLGPPEPAAEGGPPPASPDELLELILRPAGARAPTAGPAPGRASCGGAAAAAQPALVAGVACAAAVLLLVWAARASRKGWLARADMPRLGPLRRPLAAVLLCLAGRCSAGSASRPLADLARARERVPRDAWKGHDFASMSGVLTLRLREAGFRVRDCSSWSASELQELQRRIFQEAEAELLAVYSAAADNRRQRFGSLGELEAHWAAVDGAAEAGQGLREVRRDGLCHEAVMWWVHHLARPTQRRLAAEGLLLPSLPTARHAPRAAARALATPESVVHAEYAQQVSCQQCHTGRIGPPLDNATLPPPLPVDAAHPGRERVRSCDFQAKPPCGPCDGLGGRRWGDDPEQMTPMPCEAIHGPEVPRSTKGAYPPLAAARLTGDTRWPLGPMPVLPCEYHNLSARVYFGWHGDMMRMRYDFAGMGTEVDSQTLAQAKAGDPGASIHADASGLVCACTPAMAGIMHIRSFEPDDPLDTLRLPPEQGGAAYLGKVRVHLDGDSPETNGTVRIADHYMKWAFHLLVDADEHSPTFRLPLRLYGSLGVRQVFDTWQVGDPAVERPDLWLLSPRCNVTAPACANFRPQVADLVGTLFGPGPYLESSISADCAGAGGPADRLEDPSGSGPHQLRPSFPPIPEGCAAGAAPPSPPPGAAAHDDLLLAGILDGLPSPKARQAPGRLGQRPRPAALDLTRTSAADDDILAGLLEGVSLP
ncbi:unnamed protein product [Prorocentrum cordatum]|uniref:Methyltransferase domain-containing protein n=1 Tax=Prorocentrum cordatum TaxID=2364126 RepID=A0ABN9VUT3_9DINO|nr:unnamed protein product [Polarella glacialis]